MSEAGFTTDESAVPRFGRGMKLRFDDVRGTWVVLGPERAFVADEHAAHVLRLVDGERSIGMIVDELARMFAAERSVIASDVHIMLAHLARRGAIRL